MRLVHALAFAAAFGGVAMAATPGEAQQRRRPLVVEVKPRSFLDGGRTAAVGSSTSYVYNQTDFRPGQGYTFYRQGDLPLPDRYSAGRPLTVDFVAPPFLAKQ